MKFPCIRVAEWEVWENSTNGVVKHRLAVEFSDKNTGKVLESTDGRYVIGQVAEFVSAENRKHWKAPNRPKSIVLVGRRWFNRTFGNTYHSVEIIVDGVEIHKIAYAYGYDRQYEYNARNWLAKQGYLLGLDERESLWRYCERMGIVYTNTVTDVQRKKDL